MLYINLMLYIRNLMLLVISEISKSLSAKPFFFRLHWDSAHLAGLSGLIDSLPSLASRKNLVYASQGFPHLSDNLTVLSFFPRGEQNTRRLPKEQNYKPHVSLIKSACVDCQSPIFLVKSPSWLATIPLAPHPCPSI